VYGLVTGVAVLLASVLAGWLWDRYGAPATFLAGALFSLLALAGFEILRRRENGDRPEWHLLKR
jgi:predicted MFS family arabinose efflux permease